MTANAPREGFFGDIVDKFKDLINNEDAPKDPGTDPKDPPLTPQCCGNPHPGWPVLGTPIEHDANCPNHPDNLAKEEVAS